jgi:hypothetical protein
LNPCGLPQLNQQHAVQLLPGPYAAAARRHPRQDLAHQILLLLLLLPLLLPR